MNLKRSSAAEEFCSASPAGFCLSFATAFAFKYAVCSDLTQQAAFARLEIAAELAESLFRVRAEVAELADAHGSGPCTRKGVGVRVPSSAPILSKSIT